jgi:hypothetical protein
MSVSAEPPLPSAESAGAAPAAPPEGRYPDFFIAGHMKCGTTALYFMLKDHPQIFLPEEKEPRYFAPELRTRLRTRSPEQRRHLQSLERYLSLFAPASAEQRVGDASPQYIRSPSAARRIAEVQPDARIIVILREPASFLRSFHLQSVKSTVETQRSLRKAMELEELRRSGRRIPRRCHNPETLEYSRHVRYVEQLRRFYEAFPAEQVLVLIYDDFRADNEATVRRVLRFLEVDDTAPVEAVETKRVKAVRSPGLLRATNALRRARVNPAAVGPVSRLADTLTGPLRSDAFRAMWRRLLFRAPPPADEQLMLELRRRFKGEVVALSEYLDRDLVTLWGYDRIG